MFDKINITKEQAEEHIIGKSRTEFIANLDHITELLIKWGDGTLNDKTFMFRICNLLNTIKRSITIYK